MSEELIIQALALILTFVGGLVFNKPGYKKGKNILKSTSAAIDDDVLTAEEIQKIYNLIKAKAKK